MDDILNYKGYLMLWEVHTPKHDIIHVNAFSEEEAIKIATHHIKETPLYNQYKESCLKDITANMIATYPFTIIPIKYEHLM